MKMCCVACAREEGGNPPRARGASSRAPRLFACVRVCVCAVPCGAPRSTIPELQLRRLRPCPASRAQGDCNAVAASPAAAESTAAGSAVGSAAGSAFSSPPAAGKKVLSSSQRESRCSPCQAEGTTRSGVSRDHARASAARVSAHASYGAACCVYTSTQPWSLALYSLPSSANQTRQMCESPSGIGKPCEHERTLTSEWDGGCDCGFAADPGRETGHGQNERAATHMLILNPDGRALA
jgi:hypothetical protein